MAYSSLIGARVKRKEDPRLITGKGNYVGDLKLPGMHHVALVRSPYGHARIRGIDGPRSFARDSRKGLPQYMGERVVLQAADPAA